ncbi:putative synthetase [Lyophyllum shimeji]|uniref:Synthetase n=1 Tax=Lyophyllum shimeji TaxID=47721 RepID=A0A9P3PF32_LYOSH|nr:putative synthetase [Lyophyllum shimeji]
MVATCAPSHFDMPASAQPWHAQRSLNEVDAILCAPGSLHELETRLIDGRLQRVYKHLPPSMRAFWLAAAAQHAPATYVVLENQRLSYAQAFAQSVKAAGVYRHVYGVQKGDRVALCARNYPDYLVAFWACHLIGAVAVLVNAWLPEPALHYCITHTQSKLIILDPERADRLEATAHKIKADVGSTGILVLNSQEGKGAWTGMENWNAVLEAYKGDTTSIVTGEGEVEIKPEDNATIMFTSGTTGLPKGVLSTQRMYLTNLFNTVVPGYRASLRRGDHILPAPAAEPQKGSMISVPFFHATGSTSRMMNATLAGMKIVLIRKWVPEEAARLIRQENVRLAGGVPSMALDLADSSLAGYPLESLAFGGAPPPDLLPARTGKAFPGVVLSQGYGLTETNSLAVGFAGEDYVARPSSTGLPMPVNDLVIMKGDTVAAPGELGEVWIRGANIMKCYWGDPAATDKVLTKDGWLKSGDLGYLDKEGFLYIRDRIKDIIIRGGENIDSTTVENALYADERVMEAAAVGVPHPRLGEVVAAVVSIKPAFRAQDQVTEASLISTAAKSLPKFAVPVMVIIRLEELEKNASGKILKAGLRKLAREIWEQRGSAPQTKL